MIFQGNAVTVQKLENGVAALNFDLADESVNKFNTYTVDELSDAVTVLENTNDLKGVIVTSSKSVFIAGADVAEFGPIFEQGPDAVKRHLAKNNITLNRLEDLAVPVVVAINGYALGGGLEFCLACDYRLAASRAKIGFPETKLGIIPGWGGTVRLPRLAGVDTAVEWIASAKEQRADAALAAGVIDGVVDEAVGNANGGAGDSDALEESRKQLRDAALHVLQQCISGKLDFQARRRQKKASLQLNQTELLMAFETAKAIVKSQAGAHYPAPLTAVNVMYKAAAMGRDEALAVEADAFVEVAQTQTAQSLVGLFSNEQLVAKKARAWEKQAVKKTNRALVLGAGIMGGGIAYQSALTGTPIKMKDIAQAGIDLGLAEANKLLSRRVNRGRMTSAKMGETLNRIEPTLIDDGFAEVDFVIEAVVENVKVKRAVLAQVESVVSADTILTSNTSTISITALADSLQRPENFCGMHFFNPVHAMPLVEVIRGEKTSDTTVARTVAYANKMGKKAIVVNDCPGFLVNRILFPYFAGFSLLLRDGADFQQVDRVMENWGWPMGPAYLLDVVGIDTAVHCEKVMAEGFPQRLGKHFKTCTDIMYAADRYGQKNKKGFYHYVPDKRGKLKKEITEQSYTLLSPHMAPRREFLPKEIIARMMVPMATELARCLEEGIVESPSEADMALIYGLGFPPFRGGVLRWVDAMGIQAFIEMASAYAHLGELYKPTAGMKDLAAAGKKYYANTSVPQEN